MSFADNMPPTPISAVDAIFLFASIFNILFDGSKSGLPDKPPSKRVGFLVIDLMTSINSVRLICYDFLIWISLMPIVSVFSYVYDGIFLGAARGKEIRVAMIQSFAIFFICVTFFVPLMGNTGLWTSIVIFNATRAITLWTKIERIQSSFSSN